MIMSFICLLLFKIWGKSMLYFFPVNYTAAYKV